MSVLNVGSKHCACKRAQHDVKFIAITGGPGGGKTAVLEMARRDFCSHVGMLSEAAGLVFGGGFPRLQSVAGRQASQRAIYHVQRELENLVVTEQRLGLVLCDRGTVDSIAYWPSAQELFYKELHTTLEQELARYAMVIHLQTPDVATGYNHSNELRVESAELAGAIDERIAQVWSTHPRRFVIPRQADFLSKATQALALIRAEVPECCR